MRYYISDLHFFHGDMNENMDKRGFASVEDMNEYMIGKWNERVRSNDDVVILGDFSFGKAAETMELLGALKGRKYMIAGNHDRFLNDKKFDTALFKWIADYKEIKDDKRRVILSHYPIFCYKGQFHRDKEGNPKTYMLYGHVHNTFDELLVNKFQSITRSVVRPGFEDPEEGRIPCRMINCFCMFSDYTPLTLDEWIENDAKRRATLPTEF
ncbi:MAG: metallophosphoesterase family protein [Lachnospiraceae bacterium]|nr:metallophosphoesterase family protein [Lachnospiraceae bacterium]